ncbi:hypothetical protein [Janthinobacterium agaricidamnosum]|uniref:hypothetical protein n=1 Tax=Janthinobacterium agaricidamnosum TaxID=55508 RepID=UPI00056E0454|nr:hypothetical protein [Janthinobacterium agaricidamnosum]
MVNPSELSAEFILQLKHELEADVQLLKELPERISQRKKRYEAALMFAPLGFDPDAALNVVPKVQKEVEVATVPVRVNESTADVSSEFTLTAVDGSHSENVPSWTKAIQHVLENSSTGLAHKELLTTIRNEFPAMPTSVGEKGFYNGIGKLSEKRVLVKHGGLLYAKKTVDSIIARGESLPEGPSTQTRSGSSGEIILSILKGHAGGLAAAELKVLISEVPNAPASLKKHSQFIYNVLATLIGSGQVVKMGNLYRLAEKDKAPVGTGASL